MTMKALVYDIRPMGWLTCKWLRHLWRGCLLSGVNGLGVRDLPAPALPGRDWVRVRTLLGGICGTDLALIAQKQAPDSILQAFSSMPIMLGHENVAIVEELGPDVEPHWLNRRVCVEPTLHCQARGVEPPCKPCSKGQFGACESFWGPPGKYGVPAGTSIGYNRLTGGSLGEHFVAHVSQLVPVPDGITDEQAVLTDPLACSLHSVLRADLTDARRVLVYGAGMLGLGIVACLRATGYKGTIDVLVRSQHSADLARKLGADEALTLGKNQHERHLEIAQRTDAKLHKVRFANIMLSGGYDVIFDCVGSPGSIDECLKWAGARGQIVLTGTAGRGNIDFTPLWFRELKIIGAYGRQEELYDDRRLTTYSLVHELMLKNLIDAQCLLTHRFPLAQWKTALATALYKRTHKAIKVAIDFRPDTPITPNL